MTCEGIGWLKMWFIVRLTSLDGVLCNLQGIIKPMASKQWNLGKKEAMASTMQVNYVATHSKLLQDSVYIKNAGISFLGRTVFRPGH